MRHMYVSFSCDTEVTVQQRHADIVFHFGLPNAFNVPDVSDDHSLDRKRTTSVVVNTGEAVEPYPTLPEESLTSNPTARSAGVNPQVCHFLIVLLGSIDSRYVTLSPKLVRHVRQSAERLSRCIGYGKTSP